MEIDAIECVRVNAPCTRVGVYAFAAFAGVKRGTIQILRLVMLVVSHNAVPGSRIYNEM